MYTFTDPLGKTIILSQAPRRIVSLVPSQTELLYTLGLGPTPAAFEVVGITKFCVHPAPWFREKTRIGGTKDLHPERIHYLQPDLILANKEENDRAQVEELARHYPVWVSDVKTLPDALEMIRSVGDLIARKEQASQLAATIAQRFSELETSPSPLTAYFIWRNPWMVAGGDTFINDMLQRCGFINAFRHLDRYPAIDPASLADSNVQCVLLSSEPYPFKEKHIREIRSILPSATIRLVDGELFSWYGSRLLETPAYFRQLMATAGS
jgi:ABC-type Fe3+-hydroxamate transport system substrate-binding protein